MQRQTTIVAPASGGGGAIALIRLSGPGAIETAGRVLDRDISLREAGTVSFARVTDEKGEVADEVMISLFRAPASYTGEDMVEISCHGSQYIVERIISLLVAAGAGMAQPGEFTLRAFLNGKLDLSQAEAVADLILSDSAAAHRIAMNQMRGGYSAELASWRDKLLEITSLLELELDFSEEDVEFADRSALRRLLVEIKDKVSGLVSSFALGNVIKTGVPVVIAGAPNTGKSTLLNRFAGEERAIVSQIPGTTRDFIEEKVVIGGVSFRFTDTAGLRATDDEIETQGIARTVERLRRAFIVILMVDASASQEDIEGQIVALGLTDEQHLIVLLNKYELIPEEQRAAIDDKASGLERKSELALPVSAKTGFNFDTLRQALLSLITSGGAVDGDTVVVSNQRHKEALTNADKALGQALDALDDGLTSDLVAEEIRSVLYHLGLITGQITTDQILGNIFSKFCIGK